ncbi:SDR family NAD(P)-dependent oxidoreductase [Actinomycetospora endophytica]|uniref:SDR family NAD(P)-dependent oxidoreductase n=1 Tax=Actinomycetospora endophytica TaxID=2291215 RepID=A0ABS8P9F9_9PSEU|nr:SDR family NAD(P)-dependent oxidoreductase [Actinomycetospora endophytica]MCD2193659.1 SDR family NAD(P)-dependent oxidoreductase [Actinomycetospora endophytica]
METVIVDFPAVGLTGRVVVVTGASSGIGAATARGLHGAGTHPVLVARRAERLEQLSAELGGAVAVPVDVTDPAAAQRVVTAALERHGRLDGLVNNAGVSLHGSLLDTDLDPYSEVLRLNVVALLGLMQAVVPAMRAAGFGRIVNVSSGTTTRFAPPGARGLCLQQGGGEHARLQHPPRPATPRTAHRAGGRRP